MTGHQHNENGAQPVVQRTAHDSKRHATNEHTVHHSLINHKLPRHTRAHHDHEKVKVKKCNTQNLTGPLGKKFLNTLSNSDSHPRDSLGFFINTQPSCHNMLARDPIRSAIHPGVTKKYNTCEANNKPSHASIAKIDGATVVHAPLLHNGGEKTIPCGSAGCNYGGTCASPCKCMGGGGGSCLP